MRMDDAERWHFGRRKGRPLRRSQKLLFDQFLPIVALDLARPAPPALSTLFSNPVGAVILEIGFGGGEHLIDRALAHPNTGFIGCEMFEHGIAKALGRIEALQLTNVRIAHADASAVLQWLPDASLEIIYVLYPDPWPKRRHWKRRFVQPAAIAAFARVLRPGGEVRFATDWPPYATWTLKYFLSDLRFSSQSKGLNDSQKPWPGFPGTRYEAKAVREGRKPCYFVFRR